MVAHNLLREYAKERAFNYIAKRSMTYLRGTVAKYKAQPITRYQNTEHRLLRLETNQRARKPTLKHKTFGVDGVITALGSLLVHITNIDEGTEEDERIGRHIRVRSVTVEGFSSHRLDGRICVSKTADYPQSSDLEGGSLGKRFKNSEFKDLNRQIIGVTPNANFKMTRYWRTGLPVSFHGALGANLLENALYVFLTNGLALGSSTEVNGTCTVYYSDN